MHTLHGMCQQFCLNIFVNSCKIKDPRKLSAIRYTHQTSLYMHSAYLHPLNEHGTQHCSLHSFPHKRQSILPHSAAIKLLKTVNIRTIQIQHCSQFLHTRQTIPAMLSSNYIAATHNITHSPCTSTCTTQTALPTPLPSTTLLTNKHKA